MKVLADYHHADLFESLQILFEDRFNWTLYRPTGMEWFEEEYWNFERQFHGDAVAKQYLQPWGDDSLGYKGQFWLREDKTHPGRRHKMLTVEQAKALKPDIVIASVPQNEAGLARFAREVGAHYGIQIGNQWQHSDWDTAEFGLVSASIEPPNNRPHVIYRQEFSLADFRYEPPPREGQFTINSFVQCLPENPRAYSEFVHYAETTPDFKWGIYGAYGTHETDAYACGNLPSTPQVAREMRGTDVIWHTKEWSDGYGHVIHNAFASGRPVFGRAAYYVDKLAAPLWVEGVTSIDIGTKLPGQVRDELRRLRDDPDAHLRMSEASAKRFREVVNFDAEAEQIRKMFEGVL